MEIAKDLNINDFTASVGWFYKFMQRWNVKPKKQTSCISLTLEDYWNYFMKWIIIERDFLNKNNLIIERHFMKTAKLNCIFNADEVPIQFTGKSLKQVFTKFNFICFKTIINIYILIDI